MARRQNFGIISNHVQVVIMETSSIVGHEVRPVQLHFAVP
jgi:hypothetical protein